MNFTIANSCYTILSSELHTNRRIRTTDLRNLGAHLCALARLYRDDSAVPIARAAGNLQKQLQALGLNVDEQASTVQISDLFVSVPQELLGAMPQPRKPSPVPAPAPAAAAPAKSADKPAASDADWAKFQTIVIEQVGPMGVRLVNDAKAKNPGTPPSGLGAYFKEKLGGQTADQIISAYMRLRR